MRRGPMTGRGWRIGGNGWRASAAPRCTKQRCQAECANAAARRMGLTRVLVRGTEKARAVLLWVALAHNMMRLFALRRAAAQAAAGGENPPVCISPTVNPCRLARIAEPTHRPRPGTTAANCVQKRTNWLQK